jgi:hypothetical protein
VQVGAQGAGQAQDLPGKSPDGAPMRAADRLRSEHIEARLAPDVDERVAKNTIILIMRIVLYKT